MSSFLTNTLIKPKAALIKNYNLISTFSGDITSQYRKYNCVECKEVSNAAKAIIFVFFFAQLVYNTTL